MKPQFQRRIHRARRVLDAVGHAYPGAWAAFDGFRRQRGSSPDFDWPDWCYMPIAAGYAVVSRGGNNRVSLAQAQHPSIVTALATWRMTQGVYRFDPTLFNAILDTPLDGDIPVAHLQRLPEWCVYVELGGLGVERLHGVWMHLEYDMARQGQVEFRGVFDTARDPRQPFAADGVEPFALPLVGTVDESLRALSRSARHQAELLGLAVGAPSSEDIERGGQMIRPMLALALYLCADADITRRGAPAQPANPAPKRTGAGGWALHPASGPSEWDVGTRIGAALRAAYARAETGGEAAPEGRHVRPHVRRAHWHTIVSGPRAAADGTPIAAGDRRRELRWLPPIPVNVDDVDALPATVRPVHWRR